jgi:hypothetical protein
VENSAAAAWTLSTALDAAVELTPAAAAAHVQARPYAHNYHRASTSTATTTPIDAAIPRPMSTIASA